MDFYKQEIYGNILYTACRTRSLVVSVSLLYSLFGVAAILYFADKGYAGIIAGVIILAFSLWRINAVHQPVMLVMEKALLVAVPFWEIPLEKGAWAYWIHPSYLPVSYKKIIGFSDDWKILYIGTQQEGGMAQISIEGMYIPVSDKKKIIAYIERKQKNSG